MSFCPSERYALKYCGKSCEIYSNFFATEDIGKWSASFFPLLLGFLAPVERVFLGHCPHSLTYHPQPHGWLDMWWGLQNCPVQLWASSLPPWFQGVLQKDSMINYNVFHTTAHTAFIILNNKIYLLEGGREILFMARGLKNEYSAKSTAQGCDT